MRRRKAVYEIRGNQLSQGRSWHPKETEILISLAGTIPPKLIAQRLNRSYESIRQKAKREKVSLCLH